MSSKNPITIDESIALLKRSGLPTLIVEGCDDMIVYRTFEEKLSQYGVSVFPTGGRELLLQLFSRRMEINSQNKIIFIADKDVWVITGVPESYQDPCLIFTSGYSIENDIYVDGNLKSLVTSLELPKFNEDLIKFIEWYALALQRHINDSRNPIALHPRHVLDSSNYSNLIALRGGETYPDELKVQINSRHEELLRGKSLINLLIENVSYKGRSPRHNKDSLLESVAIRPGAKLTTLFDSVKSHFVSI